MRYGVIDIGSNTIRGVVYQAEGNRAFKIDDKLVRSHILKETVAKKLTEAGINRILVVLNKLKYVLKKLGCDKIWCFATSAMRDLENIEDVKNIVREATGIVIDVLAEEDEARCDFIAMRQNISEHSAIGLDLGGGSGQIVQFEYNRLLSAKSYKIGSGRLNSMFVNRVLPNIDERKQIAKYVKDELFNEKNIFGIRYLYAIGGSARAGLKLSDTLNNVTESTGFLSVEKMDKILNCIDQDPQKMFELFYDIVKNRAETVVTGLVILKTICEILDVEGIAVLSCSVRDGYFSQMMRK